MTRPSFQQSEAGWLMTGAGVPDGATIVACKYTDDYIAHYPALPVLPHHATHVPFPNIGEARAYMLRAHKQVETWTGMSDGDFVVEWARRREARGRYAGSISAMWRAEARRRGLDS